MMKLTPSQRGVLVGCVRDALVGWLTTDPVVGDVCRRLRHDAATGGHLPFSKFAHAAMERIGPSYHARSPGSAAVFPLSIAEVLALANDIELELATDDQIHAAGLIAARSPLGQPDPGGRDWVIYEGMLKRLGMSSDDGPVGWRADVHHRLKAFRRAVAAAALDTAAAE
ncbi:hypothetical protein N825_27085 [Skermanella stibiiresistens SB22]|uniref:Uncharacterized protein n=1 Tax=Skermanella stibiiresistens SB22 TaxID=1385369 RepID=W9GY53_9PROT|nr:hypothetical protein [Skermanella stibiiresistens]EWY36413.1 hypothetical protein N825_27085 [Skermanella stibiiresistens SB22]